MEYGILSGKTVKGEGGGGPLITSGSRSEKKLWGHPRKKEKRKGGS